MFDDGYRPSDSALNSQSNNQPNVPKTDPALPSGNDDLIAARSPDPGPVSHASSSALLQGSPGPPGDDLLSIKQQALAQLTPLVGKLDQSPLERFNTTMMMIQATDNPDLLSSAYDTAQMISDDKERAQALLDVVNEINYFSNKNKPDGENR
ncbi:MAG TPA: hypothetical protein VMR34_00855 [Candidatus Saccharimonadales bacterium]|nr:hypothetical protein [Candidatus Saccharimonadales bacterium]